MTNGIRHTALRLTGAVASLVGGMAALGGFDVTMAAEQEGHEAELLANTRQRRVVCYLDHG